MVEHARAPRTESRDGTDSAPRRTSRLQLVVPTPAFAGAGITEGAVAKPIRGRDGVYRRGLAPADTIAAALALALVVAFAHRPDAVLLIALAPAIVLVNKIGGFYER